MERPKNHNPKLKETEVSTNKNLHLKGRNRLRWCLDEVVFWSWALPVSVAIGTVDGFIIDKLDQIFKLGLLDK